MIRKSGFNRLNYLETARGVASIIVVIHHFLLGFFPVLKNSVTQGGLGKTPFYVFVNGTGAVAFFFVLSGFVLTQKFYQHLEFTDLAASVLKRLPRLMLPAGLSMMIGAAILIYFPHAYGAAAQLTGSEWLKSFAGAGIPVNFEPGFLDAARRSLLVFLLPHHAQYNSNLWTMSYEFYGSFIVFAISAICVSIFNRRYVSVIILHFLSIMLLLGLALNLYVPFIVGSLISFVYFSNNGNFNLSYLKISVLSLLVIIGYSVDKWYALVVASTATMILLLGVPSLERWLSGPFGLFLGKISFPLYLVHVVVLLSFTSELYNILTSYGFPNYQILFFCFVITWAFSLIAAWPFVLLEKAWVPALNRWSRSIVKNIANWWNLKTNI